MLIGEPLAEYLPDMYLLDMSERSAQLRSSELEEQDPQGADSRTTTAEALLGLLSLGPMTGYDIHELIVKSIGNFWSESFGQIYPALKRLVQDGLAEVEEVAEEGRRQRKLYRLTDRGHDRLTSWLRVPPRSQVPRSDLLLKVFFGGVQGPAQTSSHLRTYLAEQGRLLEHYRSISAMLESEHPTNPDMPYWRLTARFGLAQTEAHIRWAEDALQELQTLQPLTPQDEQEK